MILEGGWGGQLTHEGVKTGALHNNSYMAIILVGDISVGGLSPLWITLGGLWIT